MTDEDTPVVPEQSPQPYKVLGEQQVLAAEGPAVTVVRAALVYGRGGSGLLQGMIAGARDRGAATYIGEGSNDWSSVHVDDLARLYLAALTRAEGHLVVNAASRTRTSMRAIAEAVAEITGAQPVSISLEQAQQALGPFAAVLTRSAPLDASRAGKVLGWEPIEATLVDDLRTGSYALAAATS
jgi:nucleoside-diphosphate-sugar epimerase